MIRTDIVVRCSAAHHFMQSFRWMDSQGVWQPTARRRDVVPIFAGGKPGGAIDSVPDHWKWPLTCNECDPRQTRLVRDDRMTRVLDVLHAAEISDPTMAEVDLLLRSLKGSADIPLDRLVAGLKRLRASNPS